MDDMVTQLNTAIDAIKGANSADIVDRIKEGVLLVLTQRKDELSEDSRSFVVPTTEYAYSDSIEDEPETEE